MNVKATYEDRMKAREALLAGLRSKESAIAFARLATITAFLVTLWLALGRHTISVNWSAVPAAVFVVLLVIHERLKRRVEQHNRVIAFYRRAIARLSGDWIGIGADGVRFREEKHPYADDLDLFGRGSLFQLLSLAQTATGEETLASWLKTPATVDAIRERQAAVDELRDQLDTREELATLSLDARSAVDATRSLLEWSEGEAIDFSLFEKIGASVIAVAGAITFGFLIAGKGSLPFLIVAIVHALYRMRVNKRVTALVKGLSPHQHEVTELVAVASTFEHRKYSAPMLQRLWGSSMPRSTGLGRLVKLIDLIDAMRNQFFILFGVLLLWDEHIAFRLARWRREYGGDVRHLRNAVGEMEALLSLSGYAFEHPADPFPSIETNGIRFEGVDLAHPLLAEHVGVRNDVVLDSSEQLWIVSGSNMSGKSTLLRAVGTNAVLAFAGAPVRAKQLRLSDFRIAASIRINDSLQEGASRFYAELQRVKQVVDLARSGVPLLFLLDEILSGTNSHDRRIGAEAVIAQLVESGAIGLVTTHDLALAKLVERFPSRARNVHFEDHIENGVMTFDYRVKQGVVTKSNALELMRSIGLNV